MLGTLTRAHSGAIILSFTSGVTAFLFFFSPEAGDIDGHFGDIMGCGNTKYNIQKMLATQYGVGDWLFTLMDAWHHERVSCCTLPALEKVTMRSAVSTQRLPLSYHCEVENHKWNHHHRGPSAQSCKYELTLQSYCTFLTGCRVSQGTG